MKKKEINLTLDELVEVRQALLALKVIQTMASALPDGEKITSLIDDLDSYLGSPEYWAKRHEIIESIEAACKPGKQTTRRLNEYKRSYPLPPAYQESKH